MAENLIRKLLPHQGCVITPIDEGIQIAGSAMNWVMSAAVAPFVGLQDKCFIVTNEWHEIVWEIRLDRVRVVVDGEVRFDRSGDHSGIESAPSVGPCFGSAIAVREFNITALV